jgi:membrane associated rhomboid family serine protease
MLVNAAVFVVNMMLLGRLSAPVDDGGFWLAFSWAGLWEGFGLGLVRVVTYQFTHSFQDILHLALNMLVLYFFGTMAEARLGYRGTWKLYLIGGASGALLHLVLASIQGRADVPLVGASGACYAFLVYAACMAPRSLVIFIVFPLQLWVLAAGFVVLGAYAVFVEFASGYPLGQVAHGAHLGGAALGYTAHRMNWFVDWADHAGLDRPNWFAGLLQRAREKRAERRQQNARQQQLQLDEILDKVKQHGLASLSPEERRFLERMSKQARRD